MGEQAQRSKARGVRRGSRLLPVVLPALLSVQSLAGCTQDVDLIEDPSMPGVPTDPVLPDVPKDTLRLQSGGVMLAPGQERTVCITKKMPLDAALDVAKVATRQKYSHHVIFYRYSSGPKPSEDAAPKECQPLDLFSGSSVRAPVFIGESMDDSQNELVLPPGVAYHFEPGDYYTIEMHLLNASPTAAMATAEVLLTPAPKGAQVVYADMIFANAYKALNKKYDGKDTGLPPMQETTVDPTFASVSKSFKVFALTSHQHRLGTSVTVAKSKGVSDMGTQLFENKDWSHPALHRLPDDSPLTFQTGEGLRWVCRYNNTSGSYVRFGQSAQTDEMCIVWAYYYPSAGFKIAWN